MLVYQRVDPIIEIGTSWMGNVPLYLANLAKENPPLSNLEQPVAAGS